eukprot:513151-Hanusia_phi.AAC.5
MEFQKAAVQTSCTRSIATTCPPPPPPYPSTRLNFKHSKGLEAISPVDPLDTAQRAGSLGDVLRGEGEDVRPELQRLVQRPHENFFRAVDDLCRQQVDVDGGGPLADGRSRPLARHTTNLHALEIEVLTGICLRFPGEEATSRTIQRRKSTAPSSLNQILMQRRPVLPTELSLPARLFSKLPPSPIPPPLRVDAAIDRTLRAPSRVSACRN